MNGGQELEIYTSYQTQINDFTTAFAVLHLVTLTIEDGSLYERVEVRLDNANSLIEVSLFGAMPIRVRIRVSVRFGLGLGQWRSPKLNSGHTIC